MPTHHKTPKTPDEAETPTTTPAPAVPSDDDLNIAIPDIATPITVEIGRVDLIFGRVRVAADGSVTYHGNNPDSEQILHNVVNNMRGPGWDEETSIRALPRRLTNYLWAREVPDAGSPEATTEAVAAAAKAAAAKAALIPDEFKPPTAPVRFRPRT